MTNVPRLLVGAMLLLSATVASRAASVFAPADEQTRQVSTPPPVMPGYNADGALQLPKDWRRWVFVGSSLGLSYTQGAAPGVEMFHETLMEPSAYDHFVRTGTFREGTMFVLALHATGEGVLPSRRGRFGAELHGVEMAVKDTAHRPEGWAYYNFGGMSGMRDTARAMAKESCYNCHIEHARRDNVFLQFYPMLEDVAPRAVAAHTAPSPAVVSQTAPASAQQKTSSTLAIKGLDPILLVTGQDEMGKPEIVAEHNGYRYQFVSEPNRATFASAPQKYSIQNGTCLVVSGAPVDPSLFTVHDGKIYGFATPGCIEEFKRRPSEYVKP